VVEDYRSTGLTLGRHPLALLRPVLAKVARDDTRSLATTRQGSSVRIAGLVLMRQRPGTAKGVVFLTIEDEWGVGNLVVYAAIAARDRAALIAGRMLVAEGRVERVVENAEVPITHLIVRRLIDRSDLLDGLLGGSEWVERAIGRADEVKRPDPGSRRPKARLPDSRDFR
jgi:error-prone DNA polymerase